MNMDVDISSTNEAELRRYGMPEVSPQNAHAVRLPNNARRLNLVIPIIAKDWTFAGVGTTLRLFKKLMHQFEFARIIVTHADESAFEPQFWQGWSINSAEDCTRSIVFLGAKNEVFLGTKNEPLPVAEGDFFVATYWTTSLFVKSILSQQAGLFKSIPHRYFYFIQEYDPCFYPNSAESVLAESTYRDDNDVIVVFNSQSLADYFTRRKFCFSRYYVHEPMLSVALERQRSALRSQTKERVIFVYARPFLLRNGFGLLVEGLKVWAETYPEASQWTILSAGEKHPDLHLSNGVVIRGIGKTTLEEYGEILSRTWVGLALMFSAHPGQVPQEVAEFGAWSITNVTETRNPAEMAPNVIGLEALSPQCIAQTLASCCSKYQPGRSAVVDRAYPIFREGGDEFEFVETLSREWT